jgi:parallel beta-helix repeat protein
MEKSSISVICLNSAVVHGGEREMNKKIVLSAIVAVILSSFVTMCLKVPAQPGLPVYNTKSGKYFATIQAAINDPSTLDGHVISIEAGKFPESVVLNKSLGITGAGESTIIDGRSIAPFGISASNESDISITRLTVVGARTGVRFTNCSACLIDSVAARECLSCGIDLNKCHDCNISQTTVEGMLQLTPVMCGINVTDCSDVHLNDNKVRGSSGTGISLSGSGIWLRRNEMLNNRYNLDAKADFLYNIDASNTVDGKPVYYEAEKSSQTITGPIVGGPDIGFLALVNCVNMTVRGLNVTKNGVGVLLANTTESRVESSFCLNNNVGIRLVNSSNNAICGNTINSSQSAGITIESSDSVGNKIYDNTISNNNPNAYAVSDGNDWDNGYPSGGNYWSDGNHTDVKSGQDQMEPGSDAICDNPYNISTLASDRYPLVNPCGTPWQTKVLWNGTDYTIVVFSNSLVKGLIFNGSSQTLTFEAGGGTFCNVTLPRRLLDGSLTVSFNDQPIAVMSTWNLVNISAYINYPLTQSATIRVLGEYACRPPLTEWPDLNNDGKINILDIFTVANMFGKPKP